ncbi:thiamin pyrophosphokinase 1 [Aplysia californica]|uniref:Thiamin pyrophosphokinase 1 n=1 Tax=Aplysia californica TaxID=6500 RepID=A0ABM0JUC5_APLCA|nr:thiamin pyrophosphokinase 1 [Aplysia californica]
MNVLRPLSCLLPDSGTKLALIILNRPLDVPLLTALWKKSAFTAVTDGAVNRLLKNCGDQKDEFIPDVISGDFDSALPASLDYYRNWNVEILPTPDQNETDFTKCLRIVCEKTGQIPLEQIVALGSFGGRFDHTLANVNTLYTARGLSKKPTILLSEGSMACLLDKGEHTIYCDTGLEDDWCGLVPVGQPANLVTTTGLKYNLNKDSMRFGELISTSNSLASPTVTVSTDQPLLWVMGYKQE